MCMELMGQKIGYGVVYILLGLLYPLRVLGLQPCALRGEPKLQILLQRLVGTAGPTALAFGNFLA